MAEARRHVASIIEGGGKPEDYLGKAKVEQIRSFGSRFEEFVKMASPDFKSEGWETGSNDDIDLFFGYKVEDDRMHAVGVRELKDIDLVNAVVGTAEACLNPLHYKDLADCTPLAESVDSGLWHRVRERDEDIVQVDLVNALDESVGAVVIMLQAQPEVCADFPDVPLPEQQRDVRVPWYQQCVTFAPLPNGSVRVHYAFVMVMPAQMQIIMSRLPKFMSARQLGPIFSTWHVNFETFQKEHRALISQRESASMHAPFYALCRAALKQTPSPTTPSSLLSSNAAGSQLVAKTARTAGPKSRPKTGGPRLAAAVKSGAAAINRLSTRNAARRAREAPREREQLRSSLALLKEMLQGVDEELEQGLLNPDDEAAVPLRRECLELAQDVLSDCQYLQIYAGILEVSNRVTAEAHSQILEDVRLLEQAECCRVHAAKLVGTLNDNHEGPGDAAGTVGTSTEGPLGTIRWTKEVAKQASSRPEFWESIGRLQDVVDRMDNELDRISSDGIVIVSESTLREKDEAALQVRTICGDTLAQVLERCEDLRLSASFLEVSDRVCNAGEDTLEENAKLVAAINDCRKQALQLQESIRRDFANKAEKEALAEAAMLRGEEPGFVDTVLPLAQDLTDGFGLWLGYAAGAPEPAAPPKAVLDDPFLVGAKR
eukprot:gnl/TRDRNA2_/TRDRNA2_81842_c0_seq1.p1 gnl/TRDRNA2_/TRDRNA2_81842_c0~~gnl/TRDRNA2_/TRDRNA2_81842_c0_seq1.p1  ORF type:complete len:698 (+),score=142.16 gnl/TRDRNA2_/TRDRNA2_81842_c0_seq1:121-2094(+)